MEDPKGLRPVVVLLMMVGLAAVYSLPWLNEHHFQLRPVVRQAGDTRLYTASDISLFSLVHSGRRHPLVLEGTVVIDGGPVWGANLELLGGDLTIPGGVRYSQIAVPGGMLTVGSARHSVLRAAHLVVLGEVTNTVERGERIENRGRLGGER